MAAPMNYVFSPPWNIISPHFLVRASLICHRSNSIKLTFPHAIVSAGQSWYAIEWCRFLYAMILLIFDWIKPGVCCIILMFQYYSFWFSNFDYLPSSFLSCSWDVINILSFQFTTTIWWHTIKTGRGVNQKWIGGDLIFCRYNYHSHLSYHNES